MTRGRTDAGLARILVGESRATVDWLRDLGLRFEANPRMRAAHLGPGWDPALVRGTP